MADLDKAKEIMKDKLLGTELTQDVQLSALSKETFDKNAQKDEETGELFMGEEGFINAIAPEGEDYVSWLPVLVAQDQCEQFADEAILKYSTRSSANSMPSSSASQTGEERENSTYSIGAPSRTCLRSQTPSTRSRFDSLIQSGRARSNMTIYRNYMR